MGPNQTYKLLHSKGSHKQSKKTTYGMGDNVCKWCDWQGLNIQNIKAVLTFNVKKPNQKMSRRI